MIVIDMDMPKCCMERNDTCWAIGLRYAIHIINEHVERRDK